MNGPHMVAGVTTGIFMHENLTMEMNEVLIRVSRK